MITLLTLLLACEPSMEDIAHDHRRACEVGDHSRCEKAVEFGLLFKSGTGEDGQPVEPNVELANELFAVACEGNSPRGCALRARALELGEGVDKDLEEAGQLYELACGAGNAMACGRLGMMLEMGTGVKQDKKRALILIEQACSKGQSFACRRKEAIEEATKAEEGDASP